MAIQYGTVVPDRLSSLVMAETLSKESTCSTKSAHAATGSFPPSKMVPVAGVERLPQARQRYLWILARVRPALTTGPPQKGHSARG